MIRKSFILFYMINYHEVIIFVRVSDHVKMYVNHVDFRKIMYRFMSQYTLERTKNLLNLLNHLFKIFPQAHQPYSEWKLKIFSLCYGVYLIKIGLRIFEFLKIDEHSYPFLVFSDNNFFFIEMFCLRCGKKCVCTT